VFDAGGRLDGHYLDAPWIDSELVLKGGLIKIAMDWAEIGELGSAPSQGIEAFARRDLARYAAKRSNECSNECDPGGVRHILILEI
jgi:hypothetical protein